MPNVLTPNAKQQFFTNNGLPAVGYRVFTYAAGTSTKIATKVSPSGADNANPIVLDYRGECNIWVAPNVSYKYVLAPPGVDDPPTAPVWTVDAIVSSQLITLYGGVDTGSVNAYALTFTTNFTAYADGIIIYWLPANTSTGPSTLNVNGLGAAPLLAIDGSSSAGKVVANVVTGVIYRGGNFYLLYPATTSGSFTATLTGMTVATTGTVKYKITNGIVTLYVDAAIQGTSNTNAMKMTGLPAAILPSISTGRKAVCSSLLDNSVSTKQGTALVKPATADVTFSLSTVSGTNLIDGVFTAANLKGLDADWAFSYPQ